MIDLIATALTLPMIDNPFDGVLPDFAIFGVEFTELWQKLLGALWALGIVVSVIFAVIGGTKMSAATASGNPQDYKMARSQFFAALISLGILAAIAVIVGAILNLFA